MVETKVKDAEVIDDLHEMLGKGEVLSNEVAPIAVPPANVLAFVEQRAKLLERLTAFAIQATDESHWEDFGGKPRLNHGGALIVARRLGLRWYGKDGPGSPLDWSKENHGDDVGRYYTYTYEAFFQIANSPFDVIPALGTCSSRDQFLGTGVETEEKGEIRHISEVDEGDIRKKALANLVVNGVAQLTALKGVTWERLAKLGLELDQGKVGKATFQAGAKGGGASGAKTFVFRFGKGKDKRPDEVSEKDLNWYADCFRRDLADPEKARYHANTQKQLEAVEAEITRRKGGGGQAAKPQAPGAAGAATAGPTPWQQVQALGASYGVEGAALGQLVKSATGKAAPAALTPEDVAKVQAALEPPLSDEP
ncbi:MAG: hypothetical protein QME96_04525 [Myxococcota bacterium]|nr:hypothetical protein [Myxococcota bacterium]